jgi:hypothetical protein
MASMGTSASSPSRTPSCIAELALLDLKENPDSRTITFVPKPGRCVIDPAHVYSGRGKEKELVLHMTPYLAAVFPTLDLVNSESLVWLEMKNGLAHHSTKPDLFWCHSVCWMKGNDSRAALDDRNFGIIPSRSLYADVVLADCKVDMTNEAIGEFMNHLYQLSHETKQFARGIVFGPRLCHAMEIGVDGLIFRHAEFFLDQVWRLSCVFSLTFEAPRG